MSFNSFYLSVEYIILYLSSPLLQFLSKLLSFSLSLSFSHPSQKLVSRQNRSPLAGAEEIGFSPRRKPPNPTVVFSLAPSLFLSPHQLTRSSPPSSHLSHLTGTSGPIFACRHRCAPISIAPPDFSPPRSHRRPP